MTFKKGIAPIVIVLIVALGLLGGAATGYALREPIKKAINGKNTSDEIKNAIDAAEASKNKFELEGITQSVDAVSKQITVKVKSSTDSIKNLRLSDVPVTISDKTIVISGSTKDLKVSDIPIYAQVHVGGTISNGQLTATKVTIQKEDTDQGKNQNHFSVGGTVKSIGSDQIVVTVSTANKTAKDQKSKDLTIQVNSLSKIEKADSTILLSDIKTGDNVNVEGVIENSIYTANNIEIKVKEEAGQLQETSNNSDDSTKSDNDNSKSQENSKNIND